MLQQWARWFRGEKAPGTSSTNLDHANYLNEIQILPAHTDVVTCLVLLDDRRIVTASDDGTIVIWNTFSGEKIKELSGHTHPVTCLLHINRYNLVSGSSDKTLRMWNINTGSCTKVMEEHSGGIQALAKLCDSRMWVSGANDKTLCVWTSRDGDLVGKLDRHDDDSNLHCLLSLPGQRLVTGSDSPNIAVYNTDTLTFDKHLIYHRESVRTIVALSENTFASGSLDGTVVVWQADSLTQLRVLNFPEQFKDVENHVYVYSVNQIIPIGKSMLAVAIGNGIKMWNYNTGDIVLDLPDAHEAAVNGIVSLYDGKVLLTCSTDASIKSWDVSEEIGRGEARRLRRSNRSHARKKSTPAPRGQEMFGHSDSVLALCRLSDSSMCSAGADGEVIFWKDGRVESERRNTMASASINHHMLSAS